MQRSVAFTGIPRRTSYHLQCVPGRGSRRARAVHAGVREEERVIRFGPFQVDPRTWVLSRDGVAIDLSPRLVEILGYLAARRGEIVTKEELLDRFWPGINITENTLARAIADIRKSIGDHAGSPVYLQTAARRGYRFVGDAPSDTVAQPAPAAPIAASPPGEDPFQAWVKGRLALDSLDA